MTDAELYDQLTAIFREVLGVYDLVLTESVTAADVPAWDSMNHIFLLVEIEQRFGIKFEAAEMEELKNVGELVHLIKSKTAA